MHLLDWWTAKEKNNYKKSMNGIKMGEVPHSFEPPHITTVFKK